MIDLPPKRMLSAGLLARLLFACTLLAAQLVAAQDTRTSDALLNALIVGAWTEGESPYTIATFEPGGAYEARVYRSSGQRDLLVAARGTWWIKGGELYNEIQRVVPPIVPSGVVYVDRIVEITPDTLTLMDEAGRQYQKRRMR